MKVLSRQVPHPIAAILALVELMEASTGMSSFRSVVCWSAGLLIRSSAVLLFCSSLPLPPFTPPQRADSRSCYNHRSRPRAHRRAPAPRRHAGLARRPSRLSAVGTFLRALGGQRGFPSVQEIVDRSGEVVLLGHGAPVQAEDRRAGCGVPPG